MTDRPVVAGVAISHPERIVFPAIGVTKLALARYYDAIGDWIVPHLKDRPLTLVRCPAGAGPVRTADDCFYMKHAKVWAPEPLRRARIQEKTKVGEYLIADSVAAVAALVQMGVLEIHTWNTLFQHVERPDRIVLDLDPGDRVAWSDVVAGARIVRNLLAALALESFIKTTGGRGVHVVVPLTPAVEWSVCLAFARAIAEALMRREPNRFTTRFAKAGREQLLLVDYLRNNRTNTSIAAYSTRARPHGPISVPLTWNELTPSRSPDRWTLLTVPRRLARLRRDPWDAYWTAKQRIPDGAIQALEHLNTG